MAVVGVVRRVLEVRRNGTAQKDRVDIVLDVVRLVFAVKINVSKRSRRRLKRDLLEGQED